MKNGVNFGNGFAIGDTDTKTCPLKCLVFQINEENFTSVIFKKDDPIKWKLMYSIISFTFQVTRAIKLPSSARDWHVLVARFSKNQAYICDWIYENTASVSVYGSHAKSLLGTKTLTLPTQNNGWLSASPIEPCNYHDNHSQQRPDSAGCTCQSKPLLNTAAPTLLVLTPRPDPLTHC